MSTTVGGLEFLDPVPFLSVSLPEGQGLYAVVVPLGRGFRILYIGETGQDEVRDRVNKSHEKYDCWLENADGKELLVAVRPTPGLNDKQREALEKMTIMVEANSRGRPPCNQIV